MANYLENSWFDQLLLPHEKLVVEVLFRNNSDFTRMQIAEESSLISYVIRNGLAGLLYRSLKDSSSIGSANLICQLKGEYLRTLTGNTNFLRSAEEIAKFLAGEGIPVMYLKGALMASALYEDVATRPMSDVDLLVPEEFVWQASEIVIDNGAEQVHPEDVDDGIDHHLPILSYKSSLIELHRSLFPKFSKYYIPSASLWEELKWWNGKQGLVPGPSGRHLFIYLALHAYYTFLRGGLRLGWLMDLKVLLEHESMQLDDGFWQQVKLWKAGYPVRLMLSLLYLLQGTSSAGLCTAPQRMRQDLEKMVRFFRSSNVQQTSYSYWLVWDQIVNAKGLKAKWKIVWGKIKKDDQKQSSGYVLKRLAVLNYRFLTMVGRQILTAIQRIVRRS